MQIACKVVETKGRQSRKGSNEKGWSGVRRTCDESEPDAGAAEIAKGV